MMKKAGFSLLELILVLGMTVVLIGVLLFVYMMATRTWEAGQDRAEVRGQVSQAIEIMTRDLYQAKEVERVNANNLVAGLQLNQYRYCLYSSDDPGFTYTGTSYDLLKGDGRVDCGEGTVLATGVHPEVFSYEDGVVIIDLTATTEGGTVHMRTRVKPRNM